MGAEVGTALGPAAARAAIYSCMRGPYSWPVRSGAGAEVSNAPGLAAVGGAGGAQGELTGLG